MAMSITERPVDWESFHRDGFVWLGRLLVDRDLRRPQDRLDSIILGRADVDYDRLMMQLDSTSGKYGDLGDQTLGLKGPSLAYRNIEGLEIDELFRSWVQHAVAAEICRQVYGDGVPIATFRAMFMNKPAEAGTVLPWHQDRWASLDRDPLVTLYMALDAATEANGCVRVIVGSHHSLVNPAHPSAFLEEMLWTAAGHGKNKRRAGACGSAAPPTGQMSVRSPIGEPRSVTRPGCAHAPSHDSDNGDDHRDDHRDEGGHHHKHYN